MMRAMRRSLSLLLFLVVLGACRGKPLPEPVVLTLPRADNGAPFSFQDRRGEATIVFFFSTWCVPCQAMEAYVAEASRQGAKEGIEVVAVALDVEGFQTVRPYVLALRPPYPVVIGGAPVARGESPFGRIADLPEVIFLDGAGRPAGAIAGVAGTELLLERAREVKGR